jgi:hypothetical protein
MALAVAIVALIVGLVAGLPVWGAIWHDLKSSRVPKEPPPDFGGINREPCTWWNADVEPPHWAGWDDGGRA